MTTVLLKAFSLIFIIVLAYGLKKIGLFGPKDYTVAVKIVLNVTLPAAVICNYASSELDTSLIVLTLLGVLANCLMLFVGSLISRGKPKTTQALYAIAIPGYNIGAFAMPFAQNFLGSTGVAGTCLYDAGNAIMCTGGSYAITDLRLNRGQKQENPVIMVLRRLMSSVPFLAYSLTLILTITHIRIPSGVASFLQPIANANSYCAMFMIGLMFEIDLKPEILKMVGTVVLIRNLGAIVLAAGFYFLLPLPLEIRQALAVVSFAPPSALTPAFTEKCGGDGSVASCASSLCTVTALIGMTTVLMLMHAA